MLRPMPVVLIGQPGQTVQAQSLYHADLLKIKKLVSTNQVNNNFTVSLWVKKKEYLILSHLSVIKYFLKARMDLILRYNLK